MPHPSPGRSLALRITSVVAITAASAITALLALRSTGDLGIIAGCVLVLMVSAPAASRLAHDALDPAGIYVTLSALCYGVISLGWLGDSPSLPAPGIAQADIARALVLVACGLLAFSLAARLVAGAPHPRPPLTGGEFERPPVLLLVALFALGAAGMAVGFMIGAVGFNNDAGAAAGLLAYGQVFQQLALLGALSVGALALWVFRRRDRRLSWLLVALVAAQVLGGFASGYKQQALLPVVLVGAAYVACRGRVPWKGVAICALLSICLLLPATIAYRNILRYDSASQIRPVGLVDQSVEYLDVRLRLVDSVALIQARTPDVYPYGNGRRYTLLPALILLPRAVWSDKPILNDGLEFSHTYWEVPESISTATPPTQAGDLYRNFGWSGVLLGLACWGGVLGLLTRLNADRRSPRLELVCLVAVVQVVPYVDADLPQLIAGASRTLLLTGIVAWLALPGPTTPSGWSRVAAAARRRLPRLTPSAHGIRTTCTRD